MTVSTKVGTRLLVSAVGLCLATSCGQGGAQNSGAGPLLPEASSRSEGSAEIEPTPKLGPEEVVLEELPDLVVEYERPILQDSSIESRLLSTDDVAVVQRSFKQDPSLSSQVEGSPDLVGRVWRESINSDGGVSRVESQEVASKMMGNVFLGDPFLQVTEFQVKDKSYFVFSVGNPGENEAVLWQSVYAVEIEASGERNQSSMSSIGCWIDGEFFDSVVAEEQLLTRSADEGTVVSRAWSFSSGGLVALNPAEVDCEAEAPRDR